MKRETHSKELQTKNSSREESRKSSIGVVNNFIKKFNRTNPFNLNNNKPMVINSQRAPKSDVKAVKIPIQSNHATAVHSRYLF